MTSPGAFLSHLSLAVLGIVVVGLCVRRRVKMCLTFVAYAILTMTTGLLIALWPDRFWVFTFYSMKETGLVVLKVLVAVEIWQRTFASFERARLRVGLLLVVALLAMAWAVLAAPADRHPYEELLGIVIPRQQAGALALYAIVVAAAHWHRVPLHPLHRAILVGFGAYLTVYTLLLSVMGLQGASAWAVELCSTLDGATYTATGVWWAWTAWRPVRARSPIAARLQPWASSW